MIKLAVDILDFGTWDQKGAEVARLDHPLMRRMTNLQKVVASVFLHVRTKNFDVWNAAIVTGQVRIYSCTSFGEFPVICNLAEQVIDEDFPLSPKDFQNSVANASAACGSIVTGLEAGITICSGGFASMDLAIHMAALRICAGLDEGALIIHGFQLSNAPAKPAQVEWIRIGKYAKAQDSLGRIEKIELFDASRTSLRADKLASVELVEGEVEAPWLAASLESGGRRVVRGLRGGGIRSMWKVSSRGLQK